MGCIKKIAAIILIAAFLFSFFPQKPYKAYAAYAPAAKYEDMSSLPYTYGHSKCPVVYKTGDADSQYYWTSLRNTSTLPVFVVSPTISVPGQNGKTITYGFNFKIWYDKGLAVYGNPADLREAAKNPEINPRIPGLPTAKDWKTPDDDPACGTYYSLAGERGEYRYHGFDSSGNKFQNSSFPLDSNKLVGINSYEWLYRPWNSLYKKGEDGIWTKYVLQNFDKKSQYGISISPSSPEAMLENWITTGLYKDEDEVGNPNLNMKTFLDFKRIEPARDLPAGVSPSYISTLPYNYANILSAPTLTQPGEAVLWTKRGNGSLGYRTTYVSPIKNKIMQKPMLKASVSADLSGLVKKDNDKSASYQEYLNSTRDITVTAVAAYPDKDYSNDQVLSTAYYTRRDMHGPKPWELSIATKLDKTGIAPTLLFSDAAVSANAVNTEGNSSTVYKFTFKVKVVDVIEAVNSGSKVLHANMKAAAKFFQFRGGEEQTLMSPSAEYSLEIPLNMASSSDSEPESAYTPDEQPVPPPKHVKPDVLLPEPAFDIVPYHPVDNTSALDVKGDPVEIISKTVTVDGNPVDYSTFFSGTYTFGATGYDRLANIVITYTAEDGAVSFLSRWIRVLNTKPRVQFGFSGDYKQNRKQSVSNTTLSANTPEVINTYPITSYSWTISAVNEAEDGDVLTGTDTDMIKEFTFKKPGTYKITLTGTNTLGRVSDPYVYQFEILPDIAPAVICELDNISIARGEKISAYAFEAVSTDGDAIAGTDVSLYYDSNNDGIPETLIQSWAGAQSGHFPEFTASKLGMYRWKIKTTEAIQGSVIPEHVSSSDAQCKDIERDFWVDNFIPQTSLYVDTPVVRPAVDVYILTDAKLPQSKIDYIKTSRMEFNNYLRGYNALPVVEQWDMKTYTYSQPAATQYNTGTAIPPQTFYYTSNGYSGNLERTSTSDNGANVDFGGYQQKTETKTATSTAPGWGCTTYTYTGSGWSVTSSSSSSQPNIGYSDGDGFSGTLTQNGFSFNGSTGSPPSKPKKGDTYTVTNSYTGYYSGTVSRTVTYWVSNWRWVSNYTGFYNGTIYKDVREPYIDPFRPVSDKYIIYISDGKITDLADLEMVKRRSGAEIILITEAQAQSQIQCSKFIPVGGELADRMTQALDYIGDKIPASEEHYVIAGVDTLNISTDDFDAEGDPIIAQEFQYVQNPNYYDNSQGMESFSRQDYDGTAGWSSTEINKFNKVGKYIIYRRIQDSPTDDPNFADYNYYSNLPTMIVYANRIPIANATLDWDFDTAGGFYRTTWVDHSYDLDHQFSRTDRGIVDRRIMFRRIGDEWSYVIPDTLTPGEYELKYYVKDVEGYWSEPFLMNFTLNPAPPMQFNASLRAEDSCFSLTGIPASENLEVYDAWTRYPFTVYLEMAMYNTAGTRMTPAKQVYYSEATGYKYGNDINWNNISYPIPANLPDGNYVFRITAVGDYSRSKTISFNVTVQTPIDLHGYINAKLQNAEIYTDEINKFTMTTSKYVDNVQLTFKGQTYTSRSGLIQCISSTGQVKTWEMSRFIPDGQMADGETGFADFAASIPSGKLEKAQVDFKVLSLQLKNLRIFKINDYNWQDLFQKADGSPTNLQKEGIHVSQMPVYRNQFNHYISLGYKVKCKIDSMGLNKPDDKIIIHASFYALDNAKQLHPADIYVENVQGTYDLLSGSSYQNTCETITLGSGNRAAYEADPAKTSGNTWTFDYYLPYSAKVVNQGEKFDLEQSRTYNNKLLVVFNISCIKASSGAIYDYTQKEKAWGANSIVPYGFSLPSGLDLLGKGIDHGEVFWYDLSRTAGDDIQIERTW